MIIWGNSATDFGAGGSWIGGSAPTASDTASFGNATVGFQPDVGASGNSSVGGVVFANGADAFVLSSSSGAILTLGAGGISNQDSLLQTVSAALKLGAASNFTLASSGALAVSGNVNTNAFVLTLTNTGSGGGTVSGVISGTGSVAKTGTGTWTLSGANTHSGGTSLGAGTLVLGTMTALGTGTLTITGGTLDAGAALTVTNAQSWAGDFSFAGSNPLTLSGTVALTAARTVTVSANTLTSSGVVSGAFALAKQGAGTLVLSGTNTYTGATTVSQGIVSVQSAAALGTAAGTTTVASGATLQIQNSLTVAEPLNLSGTGVSGAGAVEQVSGTNTLSGAVVLNGATTIMADAGTLTLSGAMTGAGQNLTVGGAGNVALKGVVGTTTGSLTANGTGTLTLLAVNTYTGGTTLNSGTLALGVASALAAAGTLTDSGGTFNLATFSNTLASVTLSSGTISGTTGALTATALNLQSGTISAIIAGASVLTKTTNGTVTLSAANTYTGDTAVNGGTLVLAGSGMLGASTTNLTVNSGTLTLGGATQTFSAVTVTNSGAVGGGTLRAATFILQSGNLSAILAGSGAVTKNSTGTVSLSGANTYSGGTTVSAGTLRATTNASVLGSGALTLGGGELDLVNDSGLAFNRPTVVTANTTLGSDRLTAGAGVTQTLGTLLLGGQTVTLAAGANVTTGTAGILFGNTTLTANGTVFNVGANASLALGAVAGGASDLTKSGSGTLVLSSAGNRTAGATTLSDGTLVLGAAAALGTSAAAPLSLNGGSLDLAADTGTTFTATAVTVAGNTTVVSDRATAGAGVTHTIGTLAIGAETLSVAAGGQVTSGTAGLQFGAVSLTGNAVLNLGANTTLTLSTVAQTGMAALTLTGSGNLTLTGAASYTGGTTVAGGNFSLTSGASLDPSGDLIINGGDVYFGGTAQTVPTLSGTGGAVHLGTGFTLTIDQPTPKVFTGTVHGAGNLFVGGAILTLGGSAPNDYSGNTTISSGTLVLAKSDNITALSGSLINLNPGGTLQLGAEQQIGSTTGLVLGGGTFALNGHAQSLGTLKLTLSSTLDFGGSAGSSVTFANSSAQPWSGTLTITNYTVGTNHLSFVGASLTAPQLAAFSFANYSNAPGVINGLGEVTPDFSAVPEPAESVLLAGLASLLLAGSRRRRASRAVRRPGRLA